MRFHTPEWDSGNDETFLTKTESGNSQWEISLNTTPRKLSTPAANVKPVDDFDSSAIWELVISGDSNIGYVCLNGSFLGQISSASVGSTAAPFRIGRQWNSNHFTEMTIYSIEIYDRSLGVDEAVGTMHAQPSQRGGVEGQTRWFDSAWSERAAVDPERGTRKLPVLSGPPTNPEIGEEYVDDGTNTSSGNLAKRIYDGTAWVDQN